MKLEARAGMLVAIERSRHGYFRNLIIKKYIGAPFPCYNPNMGEGGIARRAGASQAERRHPSIVDTERELDDAYSGLGSGEKPENTYVEMAVVLTAEAADLQAKSPPGNNSRVDWLISATRFDTRFGSRRAAIFFHEKAEEWAEKAKGSSGEAEKAEFERRQRACDKAMSLIKREKLQRPKRRSPSVFRSSPPSGPPKKAG